MWATLREAGLMLHLPLTSDGRGEDQRGSRCRCRCRCRGRGREVKRLSIVGLRQLLGQRASGWHLSSPQGLDKTRILKKICHSTRHRLELELEVSCGEGALRSGSSLSEIMCACKACASQTIPFLNLPASSRIFSQLSLRLISFARRCRVGRGQWARIYAASLAKICSTWRVQSPTGQQPRLTVGQTAPIPCMPLPKAQGQLDGAGDRRGG